MVTPENTHTRNIVQTEQAVCMCTCVYISTYMYITPRKKEIMSWKERKERYMGGLRGRQGKEEIMQFYNNIKNKNNNYLKEFFIKEERELLENISKRIQCDFFQSI